MLYQFHALISDQFFFTENDILAAIDFSENSFFSVIFSLASRYILVGKSFWHFVFICDAWSLWFIRTPESPLPFPFLIQQTFQLELSIRDFLICIFLQISLPRTHWSVRFVHSSLCSLQWIYPAFLVLLAICHSDEAMICPFSSGAQKHTGTGSQGPFRLQTRISPCLFFLPLFLLSLLLYPFSLELTRPLFPAILAISCPSVLLSHSPFPFRCIFVPSPFFSPFSHIFHPSFHPLIRPSIHPYLSSLLLKSLLLILLFS